MQPDIAPDIFSNIIANVYGFHPTEFIVYEPFYKPGTEPQYRFANRIDHTSIWVEFDPAEFDYG